MAKVQHRDDDMLARKMSKNGRNWLKKERKIDPLLTFSFQLF